MKLFGKAHKSVLPAEYRRLKRSGWLFVIRTRAQEQYYDKCARLDAAGIDYRVWMYANEPNLVYLREYLGADHKMLRRHYIFFVRRSDLKEACRVLNIAPSGKTWLNAIGM